MTGRQLSIGDCDPMWDDWDQLCDRDAEEQHDPVGPEWWDVKGQRDRRGQRITKRKYRRTQTIRVIGNYL